MRTHSGNGYLIRAAEPSDAEALAQVHATVWRETYTGLMPEELVVGAPMEKRVAGWRRRLEAGGIPVFVVEPRVRVGVLVAFAASGHAREAALGAGEIQAINILAAHQRRGIGRRLMAACARELIARGLWHGGLWVLDSNTGAHRFYQALGGQPGPARHDARRGSVIVERSYLWPDLAVLLRGDAGPE